MNNLAMTTAKQLFEEAPLEYLVSRSALVYILSGIFIATYILFTDKSSNPLAIAIFLGMLCTLTFFLVSMVLIACLAIYWRTAKRPNDSINAFGKRSV